MLNQNEAVLNQSEAVLNQSEAVLKPNTVTNTVTNTITNSVKETESVDKGGTGGEGNAGAADASPIAPADAVAPPARGKPKAVSHQRGAYGWVKLTDGEYTRLINEYGERKAQHYIRYVDESAQQTHNKNKWTDWNLTVRKAIRDGWGNIAIPRASPQKPRDYSERDVGDEVLENAFDPEKYGE